MYGMMSTLYVHVQACCLTCTSASIKDKLNVNKHRHTGTHSWRLRCTKLCSSPKTIWSTLWNRTYICHSSKKHIHTLTHLHTQLTTALFETLGVSKDDLVDVVETRIHTLYHALAIGSKKHPQGEKGLSVKSVQDFLATLGPKTASAQVIYTHIRGNARIITCQGWKHLNQVPTRLFRNSWHWNFFCTGHTYIHTCMHTCYAYIRTQSHRNIHMRRPDLCTFPQAHAYACIYIHTGINT